MWEWVVLFLLSLTVAGLWISADGLGLSQLLETVALPLGACLIAPVVYVVAKGARRYPIVPLVAIGALVVYRGDAAQTALVSVGGLNLFVEDVVFGILAVAALGGLGQLGRNLRNPLAAALLVGLLGFSVVRGYPIYGFTTLIEFRYLFYPIAGVAFLLSLAPTSDLRRDMVRWVRWTAVALLGLALVHIATRGVGAADELFMENGAYRTTRALTAGQALIVALAALIELHTLITSRKLARDAAVLATVFFGVVGICQHRTVWGAAAAGVAVLFATSFQRWRAWPVLVTVWTLLLATGVAALTGVLDGPISVIRDTVQATAQQGQASTYSNRTQSWAQLLGRYRQADFYVHLFGFPSGAGFRRVVEGVLYNVTPHNFYVHLLLRAGPLGALSFAYLMILGALQKPRGGWRLGLMATVLVYSWGYSLTFAVTVIYALILARPVAAESEAEPVGPVANVLPGDVGGETVGGRTVDRSSSASHGDRSGTAVLDGVTVPESSGRR